MCCAPALNKLRLAMMAMMAMITMTMKMITNTEVEDNRVQRGSLVAVVAAEVKAAGWDPLSAQSAGYDVLSLVEVFGYDAVASSGCDVSFILVSCVPLLLHALRCTCSNLSPTFFCSVMAPTCT